MLAAAPLHQLYGVMVRTLLLVCSLRIAFFVESTLVGQVGGAACVTVTDVGLVDVTSPLLQGLRLSGWYVLRMALPLRFGLWFSRWRELGAG